MATVFQKIIEGELPADKVFESETVIAFRDIAPAAPVHILIVPKKPIKDLQSVAPSDLSLIAEIIQVAQEIAEKMGIADNYRLLTNNGKDAGQSVFHLHFHLIGGRQLGPIA